MADESIPARIAGGRAIDYFVTNPPWEILLLMKWMLRHGAWNDRAGKQASNNDIEDLREQLGPCYAATLPASYDRVFLHFRRYNHQVAYIYPIDRSHIARQALLFGCLEKEHTLRTMFQSRTGIDIPEYIELELAFLSLVYQKRGARIFNVGSFNKLEFPPALVQRFMENLSTSLDEMRTTILQTDEKFKPVIGYELNEQSPFTRYPLLKTPIGLYCYSHLLLLINFKNAIYDILRSGDAQLFMRYFWDVFENYVEKGVKHSQLDYLTESSLKEQLGEEEGSGFVDFVVYDSDAMILIDAKGVEMHYMGQVSEDPRDVEKHIQTSVLKGIRQAYSLLRRLNRMTSGPVRVMEETFLLIVTFKDLFLGNGSDIYNSIAKDDIDKIVSKCDETVWIPMNNIFVLSIEDFDYLMDSVNLGRTGMAQFLRGIGTADGVDQIKKWAFRQHLSVAFGTLAPPKYLNDEFLTYIDTLKKLYRR
jgi:hypothetical protein